MEEQLTFEPQQTSEHIYVGVIDTLCTGWDCWRTEIDGKGYISLHTKEEIEQELKEFTEFEKESCNEALKSDGERYCGVDNSGECSCETSDFLIHMDEYIHERKAFISINGGRISGSKIKHSL